MAHTPNTLHLGREDGEQLEVDVLRGTHGVCLIINHPNNPAFWIFYNDLDEARTFHRNALELIELNIRGEANGSSDLPE